MSLLFRINARDLSAYVRVAHEEGLDPADSGFNDPQFTGSPAFSEGMAGIGAALSNREIAIPLMLKADTSDALHTLIRDIGTELYRGAQVEYAADSPAGQSSFFDLEGGKLEPDYQYWIARSNRMRATLRLWTRPHANTGTSRLLASAAATAAVQMPATGVLGDMAALGKLEIRVGSRVASGGRMIAYGVHRSASFSGIRGPSGPDFVAQAGATVRGGSGAIGSQYLAVPVSPTTASGVALTSFLTPAGGHVGRHRVLGIMRSRLDRPIVLSARDRYGAHMATSVASVTDSSKWGLVDLGEVHVPARRSGQEAVPTQYVEIRGGGASGNLINASPALEINRLIYLPLEESPGVLRTPGALGDSLVLSDGFTPNRNYEWLDLHQPEFGPYSWMSSSASDAGRLGLSIYGLVYAGAPTSNPAAKAPAQSVPAPNASGFYSVGSGKLWSDTQAEARIILTGSPAAASPAAVELYSKMRTPSIGFGLRFEPNPHSLALMSYGSAGASVLASAGIASTLASGIYQGQPHKLILRADGGGLSGYLGTNPQAPIVTASHGDVTAAGWAALRMANGSNIASGLLVVDSLAISDVGAGASDMGPREWFRFEAYPEKRVIQGNASVYLAGRTAAFRGVHPRVPPVGSPGASGPAQMVVVSGDPTDFLGNDLLDVNISVTERFTFLR